MASARINEATVVGVHLLLNDRGDASMLVRSRAGDTEHERELVAPEATLDHAARAIARRYRLEWRGPGCWMAPG